MYFGKAQAAAVHQFKQGVIAQLQGFVAFVAVEQLVEGFLINGFGQARGWFGGFQAADGIVRP